MQGTQHLTLVNRRSGVSRSGDRVYLMPKAASLCGDGKDIVPDFRRLAAGSIYGYDDLAEVIARRDMGKRILERAKRKNAVECWTNIV